MKGRDRLNVISPHKTHLLRVTLRGSPRDLRKLMRIIQKHNLKILSAVVISSEEREEYTVQFSLKGEDKDFSSLLEELEKIKGGSFLRSYRGNKGRVFNLTFLPESIRIEKKGAPLMLLDWKIVYSMVRGIKEVLEIGGTKLLEVCGEKAAEAEIEEVKKKDVESYNFEVNEFNRDPIGSINRFLTYFLALSWLEEFEIEGRRIIMRWSEAPPGYEEFASHFISGFLNRILREFTQGKYETIVEEVKERTSVIMVIEKRITGKNDFFLMTFEVFYEDPYKKTEKARILKIERRNKFYEVILDKTIFYPEGGGQPSDRGEIAGKGFKLHVKKAVRKGDEIIHICSAEGTPREGDATLTLDWGWRYEVMQQHTGQHILSATILKLLGVDSTGFQIFDKKTKIEIEYEKTLNWEDIIRIEKAANDAAKRGLKIKVRYGEEEGLRKRPKEFHGKLRIVEIGDYDKCACGGLHVRNTVEVLPIKILRFYRKTSKVLRIEFLCGDRALREISNLLRDYWEGLSKAGRREGSIKEAIITLKEEIGKWRKEAKDWKEKLIKVLSAKLKAFEKEINGKRVIVGEVPISIADRVVEELSDVDLVILYKGRNFVAYSKEGAARVLLGVIKNVFGGKGGGSKNFVRGRTDKRIREEEVLEVLKNTSLAPNR